jgi:hypothetical protein
MPRSTEEEIQAAIAGDRDYYLPDVAAGDHLDPTHFMPPPGRWWWLWVILPFSVPVKLAVVLVH